MFENVFARQYSAGGDRPRPAHRRDGADRGRHPGDRPAIVEPIVECAVAVTVNGGAGAAALLDVLTGAAEPQGRLPFDLPRSMAAVAASRPDVPFDTVDPLFRFGHGVKL